MERRVLVTGFEPWAHHACNPAQALAEGVDGWRHGDLVATGLVLPVARDAGRAAALAAIRDLRPSVVVNGPARCPAASSRCSPSGGR